MTQALKGKTFAEAEQLFTAFHQMLTENQLDEAVLGKLAILKGVAEYPSRIKCATLAWHTLNALLHDQQQPVSTETK
jgi:nitrogen fixation NifU-like protein